MREVMLYPSNNPYESILCPCERGSYALARGGSYALARVGPVPLRERVLCPVIDVLCPRKRPDNPNPRY